jgi:hypothetical protein
MEIETKNRSLVPRPWWQVGLTILPGLIFLLGSVSSPWPPLRYLMLAVLILWIIASVLVAARRKNLSELPVWGFIPLGLLAGLFATWGLILITGTNDFYPTCLLLLVVTGLWFAWHNGLSAGLFVLAGGLVTASWRFEAGMYFSDRLFREIFSGVGVVVLFIILTPIWVLRSRSILGQAVALLFPMAAYSAALVFALSTVSYIPITRPVSAAEPYLALFATTIIAAGVYAWISSLRLRRVGDSGRFGARHCDPAR